MIQGDRYSGEESEVEREREIRTFVVRDDTDGTTCENNSANKRQKRDTNLKKGEC